MKPVTLPGGAAALGADADGSSPAAGSSGHGRVLHVTADLSSEPDRLRGDPCVSVLRYDALRLPEPGSPLRVHQEPRTTRGRRFLCFLTP